MEDLRMKAKTLWASLPSRRSKKELQSIEQVPTKPYDGPPLPATVIMHQIGSFLDHDTWHTLRSCCSDLYQESKSTVPSGFPAKMMKIAANAKQSPPKIAYTLHKGLLVLVTLELTSREEAVQEGDNTMAGTLDGDPDTPVVTLSVAIYRKSRNKSPKSKLFAFVLEDGVPWSSLDVQLSKSGQYVAIMAYGCPFPTMAFDLLSFLQEDRVYNIYHSGPIFSVSFPMSSFLPLLLVGYRDQDTDEDVVAVHNLDAEKQIGTLELGASGGVGLPGRESIKFYSDCISYSSLVGDAKLQIFHVEYTSHGICIRSFPPQSPPSLHDGSQIVRQPAPCPTNPLKMVSMSIKKNPFVSHSKMNVKLELVLRESEQSGYIEVDSTEWLFETKAELIGYFSCGANAYWFPCGNYVALVWMNTGRARKMQSILSKRTGFVAKASSIRLFDTSSGKLQDPDPTSYPSLLIQKAHRMMSSYEGIPFITSFQVGKDGKTIAMGLGNDTFCLVTL